MEKALYLVPTALGGTAATCATDQAREVLHEVRHIIAEDTKCAKRFIHTVAGDVDVDALDYYEINEHTNLDTIGDCLEPLERGDAMALMSDAGCPVVSDPGAVAVAMAHKKGLKVVPLAGASSVVMALMASGLDGQSFAFNGYLPVKAGERAKRLRALEMRALKEGQTQAFIETPYRVDAMLEAAVHTLKDETRLSVSSELTTSHEMCRTMTVREWRKAVGGGMKFGKVRAVFLIGK